jgi:hypothetical protein
MEDRSLEVLAVGVVFIILAWVTVGLRVYVRAFMLRTFALDDWLIVLTLVFSSHGRIHVEHADVSRGFTRHMRCVCLEAFIMALEST